jgi:hypothetical protein
MKGYIYKISSTSCDKYYIGSTFKPLNIRLSNHKADYNRFVNGKYHYISSFEIIKYNDATIELLEEFDNITKDELRKKEGECMKLHKDNIVNKMIAGRTNAAYYQDNKEQIKQYKQDHKDEHKQYQKQYRQDNKEQIKQYNKQKNICECGGRFTNVNKARHLKSPKHVNYINKANNIIIMNNPTINITINKDVDLEKLEQEFHKLMGKK